MYRTMLKSKIHRATVTQADLHYVGSVTIDASLMEAADLLPGEKVSIVDVTNGARLETYVIAGERDTGVVGINGAAAHLIDPGDLVIILSYAQMDSAEAAVYQPQVIFVDADNRIVQRGTDATEVPEGFGLISGTVLDDGIFPVAETADAARLDALLHSELRTEDTSYTEDTNYTEHTQLFAPLTKEASSADQSTRMLPSPAAGMMRTTEGSSVIDH